LIKANMHLNFTTPLKLHHCFPAVMKDTACLQDTWLCISVTCKLATLNAIIIPDSRLCQCMCLWSLLTCEPTESALRPLIASLHSLRQSEQQL